MLTPRLRPLGGWLLRRYWGLITQDSVSGIPYPMLVWCGSCRLRLPRTRVDSMKLGYKSGFEKATKRAAEDVGIVTALILVEAAVCYLAAARNDC